MVHWQEKRTVDMLNGNVHAVRTLQCDWFYISPCFRIKLCSVTWQHHFKTLCSFTTHHSTQDIHLKRILSTYNASPHTPNIKSNLWNLVYRKPPYNSYTILELILTIHMLVEHLPSIQTSYCILSISGILKLHKSKTWRIPGHPHISQRAILAKRWFDLVFRCTASQITNIYFACEIPLAITRHHDTNLWT